MPALSLSQSESEMIYFITGGARSGKSRYAMNLALSMSENPLYVATARIWDKEFEERVKHHVTDRDDRWQLLEEEKNVSASPEIESRVVLVDCLTLWLTNFFVDSKNDIDFCVESIKEELKELSKRSKHLILVSNEIGMGLHADTEVGRKFTDLQGWSNQFATELADEVVFMVSGLPMILKSNLR